MVERLPPKQQIGVRILTGMLKSVRKNRVFFSQYVTKIILLFVTNHSCRLIE